MARPGSNSKVNRAIDQ